MWNAIKHPGYEHRSLYPNFLPQITHNGDESSLLTTRMSTLCWKAVIADSELPSRKAILPSRMQMRLRKARHET